MSLSGGLTAGLVAGLTSRAMGGVSAWNPSRLTGLAATLLPALSRSSGLLWQNTAKTTPATADGDPVRVAVCPFTAVEFTAPSDAARPLLWDEGSGKWSLSFDGVDDRLVWASAFATPYTLAARAAYTTLSRKGVFDCVTPPNRLWYRETGGLLTLFDAAAGVFATSYSPTVNGWFTLRTQHSGSTGTATVNGAVVLGATAWTGTALGGVTVGDALGGAGFALSGRVAGVVAASSSVVGIDATNLDTYLTALSP